MKKMIENLLYPITHGKWGGRFELIFFATDESRMQVSILRPYTLDTLKTFGEESE